MGRSLGTRLDYTIVVNLHRLHYSDQFTLYFWRHVGYTIVVNLHCISGRHIGYTIVVNLHCIYPYCFCVQACYGVTTIPKGKWLCRVCATGEKNTQCLLCPNRGGALKRVR